MAAWPGMGPHRTFREQSPELFSAQAQQRDLDEFEAKARVELGLPEGPLDLEDWVRLHLEVETYRLFAQRVFYGEPEQEPVVHTRFSMAYWEAFHDMLRRTFTPPVADALIGSPDDETLRRLQPPPKLTVPVPPFVADELATYGPSGELEPRGFWMTLDA